MKAFQVDIPNGCNVYPSDDYGWEIQHGVLSIRHKQLKEMDVHYSPSGWFRLKQVVKS